MTKRNLCSLHLTSFITILLSLPPCSSITSIFFLSICSQPRCRPRPNVVFQAECLEFCRVACFELRRISTIRHYLSIDATKTLICAFVLSRIDYCNSLLAGIPKHLLDILKKNQNNAARIVLKSPKHRYVSPLLRSLHWLPITNRIDYNFSLCFSVINGTGQEYLSELLTIYIPSRQRRSASDTRQFRISSFKTKTNRQRSSFISSRYCLEQFPSNC